MSEWILTSEAHKKEKNPPSSTSKSEWVLTPENGEEGFFTQLPRDVGIGLAKLGHSALNLPHDIAEIAGQRGNEFRTAINQGLPLDKYGITQAMPNLGGFEAANHIPTQKEYNFPEIFGQKKEPSFAHRAIQKGVEYLPEILTAGNALKVLPHFTKRGATKSLNEARKLSEEREIGELNINPELIEDARQFLPNLLRNRKALEASHAGDYNSLFNLQSNVGKLSGKKAKSWFSPSERITGQAGLEARETLLDAIHEELNSLGHRDISELLRKGQNDYRRYMKFKKYRNAVGVAGAAYAVPKNPLTDLMKKLWGLGVQ